eukprot:snap_masked-scaffold804_size94796-processed-gene-0.11 protein:Tk06343 transcript:snap_masked-scaffold804_size94796-processed-gene-0.11-mRNA-1 annotation:"estrogen-related receptor isoform x4"
MDSDLDMDQLLPLSDDVAEELFQNVKDEMFPIQGVTFTNVSEIMGLFSSDDILDPQCSRFGSTNLSPESSCDGNVDELVAALDFTHEAIKVEPVPRRKRQTSGPSVDGATILCPVCGNVAGKHSYYGGQVCSSCRAFFRRSVLGKSYSGFKCAQDVTCQINSKSWKSCRLCRFQKCLQSGMKIIWVETESNLGKKPAKTKPPKKPIAKIMGPQSRAQEILSFTWTLDEAGVITGFRSMSDAYWFKMIAKFYLENPSMAKYLGSLLFDPVESDGRITLHRDETLVRRLLKSYQRAILENGMVVFFNLDEMRALPLQDQMELVRSNSKLTYLFYQSLQFEHSGEVARFSQQFGNLMRHQSSGEQSVNSLVELVDDLNLITDSEPQLNTCTFSSLLIVSTDARLRDRENELYRFIQAWPRTHPKAPSDSILTTLMFFILIFSPDSAKLKDPRAATNIQAKYLRMLHRYLKAQYPIDSTKRLATAMEVMVKLRELHAIQSSFHA